MAKATPPSRKGALHKKLGIPQGQKIPVGKLAKAAKSTDPTLKKEAVLAETYDKYRPGKKK
jgi:hypothetical protein